VTKSENKKIVTFEVVKDIYWDDWGTFRRVFLKGDICKGIQYDNGDVVAESPIYKGISDLVEQNSIKIIH
jgi:hypothetical protein